MSSVVRRQKPLPEIAVGTDITCFAEKRGPNGWEPCYAEQATPADEPTFLAFYLGQDRNYELFAILAGVQQLTTAGFETMHPARGLPPDLSPVIRKLAAGTLGQIGYHGHSWLTLEELLGFPWERKVRVLRGLVDADNYARFRQTGKPAAFADLGGECTGRHCPGIGDVRVVSHADMAAYLHSDEYRWRQSLEGVYTLIQITPARGPMFRAYVDAGEYLHARKTGRPRRWIRQRNWRCRWREQAGLREVPSDEMDRLLAGREQITTTYTEVAFEGLPYAAYAGPLLSETLPLLRSLGQPEAVRVVFWFDS